MHLNRLKIYIFSITAIVNIIIGMSSFADIHFSKNPVNYPTPDPGCVLANGGLGEYCCGSGSTTTHTNNCFDLEVKCSWDPITYQAACNQYQDYCSGCSYKEFPTKSVM